MGKSEIVEERVLGLDISSKTGWSLLTISSKGFDLEAYGKIDKISEPEIGYPASYVVWAQQCFDKILELIDLYHPSTLVIEETSGGSKSNYSQKILEFIHYLVAKYIMESGIKCVYVMSEQWRREVGCKMTKQESEHNKSVSDYKKKNKTSIAYDIKGKRVGKLTRKHINIRRTNEVFGKFFKEPMRKRNEDECDAMLLTYSYYLRMFPETK